jgi:hypothetical protein
VKDLRIKQKLLQFLLCDYILLFYFFKCQIKEMTNPFIPLFIVALGMQNHIDYFENICGTELKLGVLVANGVADLCAKYHGCSLYYLEDPS